MCAFGTEIFLDSGHVSHRYYFADLAIAGGRLALAAAREGRNVG